MGLLICLSRAAALETSAASVLAQFASIGIPKSRLRTAKVAASSEHHSEMYGLRTPSSGALCGEPAGFEALEFLGDCGLGFGQFIVCV